MVAVACVVVALARPVWGVSDDVIDAEGISIVVVLDVSASMDAQDILPSRLERAKLAARQLFESRAGDELGLVLFAGTAYIQFPLTTDATSAVLFLNAASSRSITQQGTAIEEALHLAIRSFDERVPSRSIIILMTDGEDHEGEPLRAADEAAERGITIHVVGYGTLEGGPIPVHDANGAVTGFKADRAGNIIQSRLEEPILQQIADTAGGTYQRAGETEIEIVNMLNAINNVEGGSLQSRTQARRVERFTLFVSLALIALSIEILLPESQSKDERDA
jgi:Ca-activated chloride channel family protein